MLENHWIQWIELVVDGKRMFQELKPTDYEVVRSLFQGFDYSLSIHAAIEGNNPGRIFVDDPEQPRTALALTVEGTLLAGDSLDPTAGTWVTTDLAGPLASRSTAAKKMAFPPLPRIITL